MADKVIPLYLYRVHTEGGHVHSVYVPYTSIKDFWVAIKGLTSKKDCLAAHSVSSGNGGVFEVLIKASSITVIDAPFGKVSIVLSEIQDTLKVERTKNAVKKAKSNAKKLEAETNKARKSARKRNL